MGGSGRIDTKERRIISRGNEIIVDLKVYGCVAHTSKEERKEKLQKQRKKNEANEKNKN